MKGGGEDCRGEENVEEFVYNGSKYREGTVEKYFREESNGKMSQGREESGFGLEVWERKRVGDTEAK